MMRIQTDETPHAVPSWWHLGAATLMILGFVSSVSQFAARELFAPEVPLSPGENGWSTGGLVAVVGAIYMATRCETWLDFKRRIGVVTAVAAGLAFAATYFIIESRSTEVGGTPRPAATSAAQPTRAEVSASIHDALANLNRAEWIDVFRDAKAAGQSIDHIRSALADDFENGGMPAAQYCILDYWVTEVQYVNVSYDHATLVDYCTKEIRRSFTTGELHDARTS